jgi:peptidyl-prolyl cis-trans isomerase C
VSIVEIRKIGRKSPFGEKEMNVVRMKLKIYLVSVLSLLTLMGVTQEAAAEDVVVATVDGRPIHLSDLSFVEEEIYAMIGNVTPQQKGQILLGYAIDRDLAVAAATKAGVSEQDPEVMARMELYRDKAVQEVYISRLLSARVSEEAMREAYARDFTSRPAVEEVRARHILVKDEETAKTLATKAKAGADFTQLAKDNSIGPSKDSGGDLGYFTADQMVPSFSTAAFNLEPGDVSEPVQSQFGWHVIKLEDKRTQPIPSYDEVAAEIAEDLFTQAQQEIYQGWRGQAKIEMVTPKE